MIAIIPRRLNGPCNPVYVYRYVSVGKIRSEAVRFPLVGVFRIYGQRTASDYKALRICLKGCRNTGQRLCNAHAGSQCQRCKKIYPSFFHEQFPPKFIVP